MAYRAASLLILVGLLWSKVLGLALVQAGLATIHLGSFLLRCC